MKEYRIYMDGTDWCAVESTFIDMHESPVGFGRTPVEALEALIEEIKWKEMATA